MRPQGDAQDDDDKDSTDDDGVDVFGVGLFSARIEDPKVYTHFYDDSVRMSCDRGVPKHTTLATDRLQGELIMHLMHALGIITWWQ